MSTRKSSPVPSVGFLTVVDSGGGSFLGGYLVLNSSGRPLEFQCTAPVKANRAQEILYGPTLHPYLWGEQIGGALISKSRTRPLFVCTDQLHTLAVRSAVDLPVIQVLPASPQPDGETSQRKLTTTPSSESAEQPPAERLKLGRYSCALARSHLNDRVTVERAWKTHLDDLHLREPFERIREAITEAQRTAAGPASGAAA
ncbi:MAG: hypothetical protein VX346_02750 [Planctomycetota bacterium]|nr:hypothetical protein [Planctomycetota bacterium]